MLGNPLRSSRTLHRGLLSAPFPPASLLLDCSTHQRHLTKRHSTPLHCPKDFCSE